MGRIWIFGGTTEGRRIAEFCEAERLPAAVSVATEYGEQLLAGTYGGEICRGRMSREQMQERMKSHGVELVIDATHPYAVEVTENIRQACGQAGVPYLRLLRDEAEPGGQETGAVYVDSALAAAEYLAGTEGPVMLTTGSKELAVFCETLDRSRLYPRVLPSAESIAVCEACGIPPANRIAMQGPFSEAVNLALLQQFSCRYLVTKEAGAAGGYWEKRAACEKAGVTAVVIRRPLEHQGMTFDEVCGYLKRRFCLPQEQPDGESQGIPAMESVQKDEPARIDIVGIGMGTEAAMTGEARRIIDQAEVLIGGKRMLAACENTGKILHDCYQPDIIQKIIKERLAAFPGSRIAILMSGDVGFYSGARRLLEALDGYPVRLCPGISSVQYLSARVQIPWQDMALCSVHGRSQNVLARIRSHKAVFTLAGDGEELARICRQLLESGLDQVEVYVGENLSYENERIWNGSPKECCEETFESLCSAIFINHGFRKPELSFGIRDEEFIRGKVPMTKAEIRAMSLCKLGLTKDAVVYDIGAGTGSVSIEAALAAENGVVYAIEKKEEAAELIEKNAEKFKTDNLRLIRGTAPEALVELPPPTHAFIGGSSGNLEAILETLWKKNPALRVVINAVSLETIAELTRLAESYEIELVMISAARANPVGSYHLMTGQNPVMIGTMNGQARREG